METPDKLLVSTSASSLQHLDVEGAVSEHLVSGLSPLQKVRKEAKISLPNSLRGYLNFEELKVDKFTKFSKDKAADEEERIDRILKQEFPLTYGKHYVKLLPLTESVESSTQDALAASSLRVGVVLSGGQAAGGHNVISGIFDYISRWHKGSQLYGFLGGPQGIYTGRYIELTGRIIDLYRNQGGFHMIGSGRHKIETEAHKAASAEVCKNLRLDGLVVIGGDDSNTNAAILSEYFLQNNCPTSVIGCPKTIDGDLKNVYVEASFGFDTAVKTYSEFIGNLCTDVCTSGKYYHFIRLMGRSASHIALECACQTHPNMALIGEEIRAKKKTLTEVVDEIVEMIAIRHSKGKDYGIILIPEGLIEEFPQIGQLIKELNSALLHQDSFLSHLSEASRAVFELLPHSIRDQLLLERDPHGNVQVARIATEQLLIDMVKEKLQAHTLDHMFFPVAHYFGYEGRAGLPSNFDATYCYSLGVTAAGLVSRGFTGYMAVVKGLVGHVKDWEAGGCPLTKMITVEERKGREVPVIKKHLVELDGPLFKAFEKARESWKWNDVYRSPGPIQFSDFASNLTLTPPTLQALLSMEEPGVHTLKLETHSLGGRDSLRRMSDLEYRRSKYDFPVNRLLRSETARVSPPLLKEEDSFSSNFGKISTPECVGLEGEVAGGEKLMVRNILEGGDFDWKDAWRTSSKKIKVGVLLVDQQCPGVSNVLCGLYERLHMGKGLLLGFKSTKGILTNDFLEITANDIENCKNQGGFTVLGRDPDVNLDTPENVLKMASVCKKLGLNGLVLIGGRRAISLASNLKEACDKQSIETVITCVAASPFNNVNTSLIETTIGYDTVSKCYAHLLGNLMTDAASAKKYWYFVTLLCEEESHILVEASLQTHPTITILNESLQKGDEAFLEVVSTISNTVISRARDDKQFGVILISSQLHFKFTQLEEVINEANELMKTLAVADIGELLKGGKDSKLLRELTAVITSSPRKEALLFMLEVAFPLLKDCYNGGTRQFEISRFQVGELLSAAVSANIAKKKREAAEAASQLGDLSGADSGGAMGVRTPLINEAVSRVTYSPVCFFLGFQARSSLPSNFDCALAYCHGLLAGLAVQFKASGYATCLKRLSFSDPREWVPQLIAIQDFLNTGGGSSESYKLTPQLVHLRGDASLSITSFSKRWEEQDLNCNPGPLQFKEHHQAKIIRSLYEEHGKTLGLKEEMRRLLQEMELLCKGGTYDESHLISLYVQLKDIRNSLTELTSYPLKTPA